MTTVTKTAEQILAEAFAAADKEAVTSNEDAYCGFAWVKIYPARGPLVKLLKEKGIGSKAYEGGWSISSSSCTTNARVSSSQSMTLKENVCAAFAKSLQANGVRAYMSSRAD